MNIIFNFIDKIKKRKKTYLILTFIFIVTSILANYFFQKNSLKYAQQNLIKKIIKFKVESEKEYEIYENVIKNSSYYRLMTNKDFKNDEQMKNLRLNIDIENIPKLDFNECDNIIKNIKETINIDTLNNLDNIFFNENFNKIDKCNFVSSLYDDIDYIIKKTCNLLSYLKAIANEIINTEKYFEQVEIQFLNKLELIKKQNNFSSSIKTIDKNKIIIPICIIVAIVFIIYVYKKNKNKK